MTVELIRWIIFGVLVVVLLGIDLGAHRKDHVQSIKESLLWSAFWISIALLFNVYVYFDENSVRATEFLTAYLLEKSLSIDNLFVFIMIFSYFKVEASHQHRVLFWGIFGAIVMRAIFIFAGVKIIQKFEWVMVLFGLFLLYSGVKLLFEKEGEENDENWLMKNIQRFLPVSLQRDVPHFFVKENGKTMVTYLFLALLTIEASDLLFAIDSIPAVLSVSTDMYIVYTSNIFAILGLRSLYFALNGIMSYFYYLRYALAGILSFIGVKMMFNFACKEVAVLEGYEISNVMSLLIIISFITISIIASVKREKGK